jgi:CPA2 family monovalent cation:H+ antiporter-2
MHSDRLVLKLAASDWLMQSVNMTTIAQRGMNTSEHIIICGFGRSGQNLARLLEQAAIPYFALDLDPDRVRQASAAGQPVVFGDATRVQALLAAGLTRAAAVVVTYQDTPSALKILQSVRQRKPNIPVVVRTIDDADLEVLQAAGATEVVPEAIEGSLMLASHALVLMGVPMRRVLRMARDQRDARYSLLRGYFHGADDDTAEELHQARLQSLTLPAGAQALGQSLAQCRLGELNASAVSVRRADGHVLVADDEVVLQAGDTLVLSGKPDALARAEARLLGG